MSQIFKDDRRIILAPMAGGFSSSMPRVGSSTYVH